MKRLVLIFVLMTFPVQAQETIYGVALPIDGDTIIVKPKDGKPIQVRLWGIDAPEMKDWPWGPWARGALDNILPTKSYVRCTPKGKSYKRIVAQCRLQNGKDNPDIGGLMVESGYAVAHRGFSGVFYLFHEYSAQNKRVGVWGHPPWKKQKR